jgi:hypothetical protein
MGREKITHHASDERHVNKGHRLNEPFIRLDGHQTKLSLTKHL